MKISKYLASILKDFFTAFGGLVVIAVIYLSMHSIATISTSLLYQLILGASALTFLKNAFSNKHEFNKKAQHISFFVCLILADMMILIWMFFFSPGRIIDRNLIFAYFAVLLISEAVLYAMTYLDGRAQEKQLNRKLREYKQLD
jgi:hypothetical protein